MLHYSHITPRIHSLIIKLRRPVTVWNWSLKNRALKPTSSHITKALFTAETVFMELNQCLETWRISQGSLLKFYVQSALHC